MTKPQPFHLFLIVSLALILLWSGVKPRDFFTWFLEVLPVLIGLPVLFLLRRKIQFTDLVYLLLWIHAIILMVGGHYTYAENPLFNWLKETFHLARNYYDRLGHFAQGFIPALVTREVLLKTSPLKKGKWLFFIVVCICLAISAVYELFEWGVALATGTAAEAFLGTQGDSWDTQWDMFLALIGCLTALLSLANLQDRLLARKAK